ncbi:hypothetical protein [Mycolicibacterium chitae]|uniref:Uncharacterized protein n=1 Tax=Mycolicibacterium chitae TaxID=1792 RepID=A0A3S4V7Z8_MYCCI|nr:hypothetical protein [Mycolicibacterium chitae]MCV7105638.1 hypothetical protein [Mycolicibacterium chitae]VEG45885.1 Uncharacterised protein [Mycolicibacterium chitae]
MARAAVLLAAVMMAVLGASAASADPDNLLPWCSGDQSPMDNSCKVAPSQVFTHDHSPGADPEIPLGLDPTSG